MSTIAGQGTLTRRNKRFVVLALCGVAGAIFLLVFVLGRNYTSRTIQATRTNMERLLDVFSARSYAAEYERERRRWLGVSGSEGIQAADILGLSDTDDSAEELLFGKHEGYMLGRYRITELQYDDRGQLAHIVILARGSRGGSLEPYLWLLHSRKGGTHFIIDRCAESAPNLSMWPDNVDYIHARNFGRSEFEQLQGFKRLERLRLDNNGNKVDDEALLAVSRLQGLVSLNLSGTESLNAKGLCRLADLKHLAELDLHGAAVNDSFGECLGRMIALRSLHVGETDVSDVFLSQLAGLSHLEFIDLQGCKSVSTEGVVGLLSLPSLKTIRLNKMMRVDLIEVIEAARKQGRTTVDVH